MCFAIINGEEKELSQTGHWEVSAVIYLERGKKEARKDWRNYEITQIFNCSFVSWKYERFVLISFQNIQRIEK